MKLNSISYLGKLISLFAVLLFSHSALASTELCFKKEISNDGINWYDANTEAEAVAISDVAHFRFTAFKCEGSWGGLYNIKMTDPDLNIYDQPMDDLSPLEDNFDPSVWTYQVPNYCDGYEGTIENVAHVEGLSMLSHTPRYDSDNAWALCEPTIIIGGDGCTPGYWKQPHHLDSWPLDPNTLFSDVFDREITIRIKKQGTIDGPTLLQALDANGGKVNTAARHAVAAYLNALNSDVNYDMTTSAVVSGFQYSFDNNDYGDVIENLVNFNEQGCPLN